MTELEIAPLVPAHFEACLTLWQQAGLAHEADLLDRLGHLVELHPQLCKVAVLDGRVLGCVLCSYNGFSLYVFRLVVVASHRGKGIGSRLMEACEEEASKLGAAKVMLFAEGKAVRWYERRGYLSTSARFLFKVLGRGGSQGV